jgi:hypothetical protein
MEEITAGNTHPRLIETMGSLQDKMANITKMQANYILFLEDTYKKLNNDAPANPDNEIVDSDPEEGQFFITVGTKNVIKKLPAMEKPDLANRVAGDLLNPANKTELMRENNVQIQDDDASDDFIDLTGII